MPDATGHFGPYGGRFVPETLMHPLQELEEEYFRAQKDPEFQRELAYYLEEFCGRPTPLYLAERLTRAVAGPRLLIARRDTSVAIHTTLRSDVFNHGQIGPTFGVDRILDLIHQRTHEKYP